MLTVRYSHHKQGEPLNKTVVVVKNNGDDRFKQATPIHETNATVKNNRNLLDKPGGAVLMLGLLSEEFTKFTSAEMTRLGEKVLEDAKSAADVISGAMMRSWPYEVNDLKDLEFPMTKTLLLINEIGKTAAGVSVPNEKGDAVPFGNKIVIPKSELTNKFEHLYGKLNEEIVFEILKAMGLVKDHALKGEAGEPDTPMIGLTLIGASLAGRFQQKEQDLKRREHDLKLIRELTDTQTNCATSQPK
jgi:hypothetical protein